MSWQWLTTHTASTDHDISIGIRENFNAQRSWQAAITKIRAARRFNENALAAAQRRSSAASSLSASNGSLCNRSHMSVTSGGWNESPSDGAYGDEIGQGSVLEGDKLREPPEQIQSELSRLEIQPSFSLAATPTTPIQANYSQVPMLVVDDSPPSQNPRQTNEQSQPDPSLQTDSLLNTLPRPGNRVLNRMPGGFHEDEEEEVGESPLQAREELHDRLLGFFGRMKKRTIG